MSDFRIDMGDTYSKVEQGGEFRIDMGDTYKKVEQATSFAGVTVEPWEMDVISRAITEAEDPDTEAWKWANAAQFAKLYNKPLEEVATNLDSYIFGFLGKSTPPKTATKAVVDMLALSDLNAAMNKAGWDYAMSGGRSKAAVLQYEELSRQAQALADNVEGRGLFTTMLKHGAENYRNVIRSVGSIGASAAAGAVGGGAGLAAAAAFFKVGTGAWSAYDVAGSEYMRMRQNGVDHDIAAALAAGSAGLQGVIEVALGTDAAVASLLTKGAVGSITSKVTQQILMKGILPTIALRASARMAMTTFEEGVEEGLQELTSIVADLAAAAAMEEFRGVEIDRPKLEESLKQIGESVKAGALAAPVFGFISSPMAIRADYQSLKGLQQFARESDRETFMAAAAQSQAVKDVLAGMSEPQQKEHLEQLWKREQEAAKEDQAEKKKEAEVEYLKGGSLYTGEDIVSTRGDGSFEAILKAGSPSSGERYGYLRYEMNPGKTEITLKSANGERVAGELMLKLAAQYPGIPIKTTEASNGTAIKLAEKMAELNPRGKDFGAQWFDSGNIEEDQKVRAELKAQIMDAFGGRVDDLQAELNLTLIESNAWAQGLRLSEYRNKFFGQEAFKYDDDLVQREFQARQTTTHANVYEGQQPSRANAFTRFDQYGKAMIVVAQGANFRTMLHETGHVFQNIAKGTEAGKKLESYYGVKASQWTIQQSEQFVDDLLQYYTEGTVRDEGLKGIFNQIAKMLKRIIKALDANGKLNPELKGIFDELFSSTYSPLSDQAGKGDTVSPLSGPQRGEGENFNSYLERVGREAEGYSEEQKLEAQIGVLEARIEHGRAGNENFNPKSEQAEIDRLTAELEALRNKSSEDTIASRDAIAEPDRPTVGTYANPSQHPVLEVPVDEIFLSEDVPNFKEGANAKTGAVEPIKAEGYVRLGTAPIVVWERVNGRKEVITGRHRLDLAKRLGEATIPAQIIREADGFTKEQASMFDAEANIRDGQGSVRDYANYFRNTEITEEEASRRGLLSRDKGRQGWAIGKYAGNALYALYRDGKIAERKAAAIAESSRGDERLQEAGIQKARAMTAEELFSYVRLLSQSRSEGTQLDMFGNDDSLLIEAEKMSKEATRIMEDMALEANALKGALKLGKKERAAILEKYGVKAGDAQAIQARVEELEQSLEAWSNWTTDREKVRQIRKNLGLHVAEETVVEDEVVSQDTGTIVFGREANMLEEFIGARDLKTLDGDEVRIGRNNKTGVISIHRGAEEVYSGTDYTEATGILNGMNVQWPNYGEVVSEDADTPMMFEPAGDTESEEFKAWFGDWTDPMAFTSKAMGPVSFAVGENGAPIKLYHSTRNDFDSFEVGRPTFNSNFLGPYEVTRYAIFATPNPEFSAEYVRDSTGGRTLPVYMNIRSPMILSEDRYTYADEMDADGMNGNYLRRIQNVWELFDDKDFVDWAKSKGYDGAIFEELDDSGTPQKTYAAFSPTQIKSVFNRGTWSKDDARIMFEPSFEESILNDEAARIFGVTTNPNEAGFVLSDGRMLNFSGKQLGEGTTSDYRGGVRMLQHSAISQVAGLAKRDPITDFMKKTGAIRVDFQHGAIYSIGIPSFDAAARIAGFARGHVTLHIDGPDGQLVGRKTLQNADPVAIAQFYDSPTKPETLSLFDEADLPAPKQGDQLLLFQADAPAKPLRYMEAGYTGPSGHKLVGYIWHSKIEDRDVYHNGVYYDTVGKRVSDWDNAQVSTDTGRQIVHEYLILDKDTGKVEPQGIVAATKKLGLPTSEYLSKKAKQAKLEYEQRINLARGEAQAIPRIIKHYHSLEEQLGLQELIRDRGEERGRMAFATRVFRKNNSMGTHPLDEKLAIDMIGQMAFWRAPDGTILYTVGPDERRIDGALLAGLEFVQGNMGSIQEKTTSLREYLEKYRPMRYDFAKEEVKAEAPKKQGDQFLLFEPAGDTESEAFKQWFDGSKIVGQDGEPQVFYHQTHKDTVPKIEAEGFRTDMGRARLRDDQVPDGIFFKPEANDIRVGASSAEDIAQVPVYLSIKKPFTVSRREDIERSLGDEEYSRLAKETKALDTVLAKEFNQAWDTIAADPTKEAEWDAFSADWENRVETELPAAAAKARARLTEVLKDRGFDGMIIEEDQGSFGRSTKTVVAFRSEQAKSIHNRGTWSQEDPRILFEPAGDTDSDNFKAWFGESKAVDQSGKPLRLYHGSPDARFAKGDDAQFKTEYDRYGMGRKTGAFWFTPSLRTAKTYADERRAFDYQAAEAGVVEAYLSMQNPLIVDAEGKEWREAQRVGKTSDVIERARSGGHDGVIIRNVKDDYNNDRGTKTTDTYVVFAPTQIKAVENRGAWSQDDPRILFEPAREASVTVQNELFARDIEYGVQFSRSSSSRYYRFQVGDQAFQVRVSDHDEPPAGGYYGPSDYNVDTRDPQSLEGFKAWLDQEVGEPVFFGQKMFDAQVLFEEDERTDTPEFKRWFSGSKVVDAEGKPLVVYHGTKSPTLEAFRKDLVGSGAGHDKIGFFFTDSEDVAAYYGQTMPVYLKIEHPATLDTLLSKYDLDYSEEVEGADSPIELYDYRRPEFELMLRSGEFDGAIIELNGERLYIAIEPEQIKSFFNHGTWDASNPRLLFEPEEEMQPFRENRGKFSKHIAQGENLETFLGKLWDSMKADYDTDPEAGKHKKGPIEKRLASHPFIIGAAITVGKNKKPLGQSVRRAVLGTIRKNELAYKEFYAEVMNDLDMAHEARQERESVFAQVPIKAPKLTRYETMSVAERQAIIDRIRDAAVREKIDNDTITDQEIMEYIGRLEDDRKALKETEKKLKKARDLAAEIRALYKVKELRQQLVSQIMEKPNPKTVHYDQKVQIRLIQDYLKQKKWEVERTDKGGYRRTGNIIEPNVLWTRLSQFFKEHPGLESVLTQGLINKINDKPLSAWSVEELKQLRDIVDKLRKVGRGRIAEQKLFKKMAVDQKREELYKKIVAHKKYKEPGLMSSAEDKKYLKGLDAKYGPMFAAMNAERFFEYFLDDGDPDKTNWNLLSNEDVQHRRKELQEIERRISPIEKVMKEKNIQAKQLFRTVKVDGAGPAKTTFTLDDLMWATLAVRNKHSRLALMGSLLTETEKHNNENDILKAIVAPRVEAVLQAAQKNMTQDEVAIMEMIAADFDKEFERLNKAVIAETNEELRKESNYVPIVRVGVIQNMSEQVVNDLLSRNIGADGKVSYMQAKPEGGWTKSRVDISLRNQPPAKMGLLSLWIESVEKQEHYVEYSDYLSRLNRIYRGRNSGALQEAIKHTYGTVGWRKINDHLNEIASPSQYTTRDASEALVRAMRGHVAVGVLSWRLASAMNNLVSTPMPYLAYAPGHLFGATAQMIRNPAKFLRETQAKSELLRSQVAHFDPLFDQIKGARREGAEKLVMGIGEMGMKGLSWTQEWMVTLGWRAVYNAEMAKHHDEARAIDRADYVTRHCQPSSRGVDMSPLFKDSNEWKRAFTQFGSQLNVVFQQMAFDIPHAFKEGNLKEAFGIMVGMAAAGLALGAVRQVRGKDEPEDEDDYWKTWLFYAVSQTAQGLPLIGGVASNQLNMLITGQPVFTRGGGLMPAVEDILTGTAGILDGLREGEVNSRKIGDVASGVAQTLGLPALAVEEYWKWLAKVLED